MTVYVVQNQQRRDPLTRQWVPAHDVSPALEYGEVVFLLGPKAVPFRPEIALQQLREGLRTFNYEQDWLLFTGSPIFIGWAMAIAADMSPEGEVGCLQWSSREGRYHPIRGKVFGDCGSPRSGPAI